ncbi:hypothetical protein Golomagni_04582 [Golovinomyces magnicellulatus]|nr:hypothetical protein Golomagni_04582 [Golovinomyces magnicellulatus]
MLVTGKKDDEKRRGPGRPRKETQSQDPTAATDRSRRNYGILKPFMDSLDPLKHAIVAIQEPSIHKSTLNTYCPPGYSLCMEPKLETKVAFLISTVICASSWSFRWYSCFVAEVTLQLKEITFRIVNVYSPITSRQDLIGWDSISKALTDDGSECIVTGDFNCHHPLWGGLLARRDIRAQNLLHLTENQGLKLVTPCGIPTFRRRGRRGALQETVIDLTFATQGVADRIQTCLPREDWSIRLDHIPIEITIETVIAPPVTYGRYSWKRADTQKMKDVIRQSCWDLNPEPLVTLQSALSDALRLHCPKARPSSHARAAWSHKASLLLTDMRKSRRQAIASAAEHDFFRFKSFRQEFKKEIYYLRRLTWNRFTSDLCTGSQGLNNKGLWKLSRLTRKSTELQRGPPQLPAMRRNENDHPTENNNEKVTILQEKFFPLWIEADLSDISVDWYPKRSVAISSKVTSRDVERILTYLPRGKAPGPDEITNDMLQDLLPEWSQKIADGITTILTINPKTEMKVLGIVVNSRLRWGPQVAQAARRGEASFNALSKITSSVWGPSMRKSRLLYTPVVRPIMTYGSQIWGNQKNGQQISKNLLGQLTKVQNNCLRKITGGYKRTPIPILEREAAIPPLDLHLQMLSLQYGISSKNNSVTNHILKHVDALWLRVRRQKRNHFRATRNETTMESTRRFAQDREREMQLINLSKLNRTRGYILENSSHNRKDSPWTSKTLIKKWANMEWKRRWLAIRGNRKAASWKTPWSRSALNLYDGLKRHVATALMLLRSEVLGLRAWLSSIGVPNITPRCSCGEHKQTVKHILCYCPEHSSLQARMFAEAGTRNFDQILQTRKGCKAAAFMLIATGRLQQFEIAQRTENENQSLIKIPLLS